MRWRRKIINGLAMMLSVILFSSNVVYATVSVDSRIIEEIC